MAYASQNPKDVNVSYSGNAVPVAPYYAAVMALEELISRLDTQLNFLADQLGPFLRADTDQPPLIREVPKEEPQSASAVQALMSARRQLERMEDLVASLRSRLVI